jgi:hypothetical protein
MMSESRVAEVVSPVPIQRRNRYSFSNPLRAACAGIVAVLLLAFAFTSAPPKSVRADDGPQSGQKVQAPDSAESSTFKVEIQRNLKKQYDRMINLANELIDNPHSPSNREDLTQASPLGPLALWAHNLDQLDNLEDQVPIQKSRIEAVNADLRTARLKREIAELALTEYEQGIFAQEKAAAEDEIKIAKDELEKARANIPVARDRLVRIRLAAKGSTSDLNNEFVFTGRETSAQLSVRKAEFVLEQAESKLKVLLEYTKVVRIKYLQSDVEKTRSNELARKATWQLEESRLKKLERLIKARDLPSAQSASRILHHRQALAVLDRAIPIEERLRTKMEQLTKDEKSAQPLRKEIQDLSDQLRALVDQAEIEHSAAQFDTLKTRFQSASYR